MGKEQSCFASHIVDILQSTDIFCSLTRTPPSWCVPESFAIRCPYLSFGVFQCTWCTLFLYAFYFLKAKGAHLNLSTNTQHAMHKWCHLGRIGKKHQATTTYYNITYYYYLRLGEPKFIKHSSPSYALWHIVTHMQCFTILWKTCPTLALYDGQASELRRMTFQCILVSHMV